MSIIKSVHVLRTCLNASLVEYMIYIREIAYL